MRDLFSTAAPVGRDTSAEDARRARAAKAANTAIFAQAPSPLRTMVAKAERLAAEAEREVVARITARKHVPTLAERKAALPPFIACETEGAFGVTVGAAELLARVVARRVEDPEPALISPSSFAGHAGCTPEEARRQMASGGGRRIVRDFLAHWRDEWTTRRRLLCLELLGTFCGIAGTLLVSASAEAAPLLLVFLLWIVGAAPGAVSGYLRNNGFLLLMMVFNGAINLAGLVRLLFG